MEPLTWAEAQKLSWPEWKERMAEMGWRWNECMPYPERGAADRAYSRWFEAECKAGRPPDYRRLPHEGKFASEHGRAELRRIALELNAENGEPPSLTEMSERGAAYGVIRKAYPGGLSELLLECGLDPTYRMANRARMERVRKGKLKIAKESMEKSEDGFERDEFEPHSRFELRNMLAKAKRIA